MWEKGKLFKKINRYNQPTEEPTPNFSQSERGTGYNFSEKATKYFLHVNNLSLLLRSFQIYDQVFYLLNLFYLTLSHCSYRDFNGIIAKNV